jgi:hypothetical protein
LLAREVLFILTGLRRHEDRDLAGGSSSPVLDRDMSGAADMTANVRWTLPVPSTALLDGGPALEKRLRREVGLRFSYEGEDGTHRSGAVVFEGVEAFKCTYYRARGASMLHAYDKLVDEGQSPWLREVIENLEKNGGDAAGLCHLMINFDDGPAYEVVCRSFRVEGT